MATQTITGIHHITAVASDPQANLDFYTDVLGLRLVKLTVNFDDPGSYHFYFGDAAGNPGTILTFFPWPGAPRGTVGNGQVAATAFAVPLASLDYWQRRLSAALVPVEALPPRFGEPGLRFVDPDGMPLELIGVTGAPPAAAVAGSTVPAEHAITGFHSATLAEANYAPTATLLQDVMGWSFVANDGHRFRYRATGPGGATLVDIVHAPHGRFGQPGAGTVHHIAWRTPTATDQRAWRAQLVDEGFHVSPVMDRTYFESIYYREPGGILFEIATDPPGFAVDEPAAHLGERLMLPAQFEQQRAAVARVLPRLTLPHEKTSVRS